jgi:hypothetical protein
MADRRAFALILVLVIAGVIFAAAMQVAAGARAALVEAGAMRDRDLLAREARSAVSLVVAGLTSGRIDPDTGEEAALPPSFEAAPGADLEEGGLPEMPPAMRELLGQLKGEDPEEDEGDGARLTPGQSERRAPPPGRDDRLRAAGVPTAPLEVTIGARRLLVSFHDASGLLDLNRAEEPELVRFFSLMGVEERQATAIAHQLLDWRDEDDFMRPLGAERADYERMGVVIRNCRLRAVEELLYLPAMTREVFERVRHTVTVSGDGKAHAPTASREILLSIPGMPEAVADRIIAVRTEGQLTPEAMEDVLAPLPAETLQRLRLAPGAVLRAVVRPADAPGPRIRVDFVVTPRSGVQFLTSEVY